MTVSGQLSDTTSGTFEENDGYYQFEPIYAGASADPRIGFYAGVRGSLCCRESC